MLRAEIEAVASFIGKAPSTVGEMTGQGGQFYARLGKGARVWPETAEKVMARLHDIKASVAVSQCDTSHGPADEENQGSMHQFGKRGAA
ncbi:hypothetical protein DWF04_005975 [Cereibacter sphaeroides f. sp. denitrificans]